MLWCKSCINGLYIIALNKQNYQINNSKRLKSKDSNHTYLWHCRLEHVNEKCIKKLNKHGLLNLFDFESYEVCESCFLVKMTNLPFTRHGERANDLFELIHLDVGGPMCTSAKGGYEYFINFKDDLSRYEYIYLVKHKSESFYKFKEFQNEIQNQLCKAIKVLRSN